MRWFYQKREWHSNRDMEYKNKLSLKVEKVTPLIHKRDVERIDIEINADKEDVTEKVYQKIKGYVKEKYGLPMHEALNKVDVSKREYPRCLEEKVKTIEGALKHFKVIGYIRR